MGLTVWQILDHIIINLYFLFYPLGDEKSISGRGDLVVRLKLPPIPPVLEHWSYATDPASVRRLINDIEGAARRTDTVPYYANLAECRVTAVAHLRSASGVHEVVVLTVRRGRDERHVRFERFPEPPKRRDGTVEFLSFGGERWLQLLAGKITNRADSASISDLWTNVTKHHTVVQRFAAESELLVLDAIALANLLGEIVGKYSLLPHMCFWYAAALFHLLHTRTPAARITKGPAYARGGTCDGKTLVDVDTGTLLWPASDSEDQILNAYEAAYGREINTSKEQQAELHDAIRAAVEADADALSSHGSPDPALSAARETSAAAVAQVHARIKKASDETESLVSQFARTREEISEINRQAERDRRARDAADAETARLVKVEAYHAERAARLAAECDAYEVHTAELTTQLRLSQAAGTSTS